jgi:hypothetical protein
MIESARETTAGSVVIAVLLGTVFVGEGLATWFGWLRIGGLPWFVLVVGIPSLLLLIAAEIRIGSI